MSDNWKVLWSRLHESDFLIHVLDPLMTYGLMVSVLLLLFTLFMKDQRYKILSVVLVMIFSFLIFPATSHRTKSQPILSREVSIVQRDKIKQYSELRNSRAWQYYALGIVALLSLFLSKSPKLAIPILVALVFGGLFIVIQGMWFSLKEWEIYRPSLVRPAYKNL